MTEAIMADTVAIVDNQLSYHAMMDTLVSAQGEPTAWSSMQENLKCFSSLFLYPLPSRYLIIL